MQYTIATTPTVYTSPCSMCRHFCNVEPFQSTKCQNLKLRKLRISLHQGEAKMLHQQSVQLRRPRNERRRSVVLSAVVFSSGLKSARGFEQRLWKLRLKKLIGSIKGRCKDCNSGCWDRAMLRNSDIQRYPCLCVIKSRVFKHDLPSALVLLVSQALRKMQII